jgi:hypothetical protein
MIINDENKFDEQIPVANNGDACSHEERLNTIKPLANRTRHLKLITQGSVDVEPLKHADATPTLEDIFVPQGTTVGALNPWRRMGLSIRNNFRYWGEKVDTLLAKAHGLTPWEHFIPAHPMFSSNFTTSESLGLVTLVQSNLTTPGSVFIAIPQVAHQGKPSHVTNVQVLCRGVSHGSMPATMPRITLYGYDSDFTADPLGTASDPSPDLSTYDLQHYFNIPGLTPVQVGAYPGLVLKLEGEADPSPSGGFRVAGFRVTFAPS